MIALLVCFFGVLTLLSLHSLHRKVRKVMITQAEFQTRIDAVDAKLGKAKAEIVAEIALLRSQLGQVTPEAEATLQRLEEKAGGLDDLNPDQETPPPADQPTP